MKALALLVSLVAMPAESAAETPMAASRHLWATVNACDTAARPNTIGIRASMPGSGRRETLLMRFRAQYLDAEDGRWHFVPFGADSGLVSVGITRSRRLESGYDFEFQPPAGGGAHILRGHVTFVWRRGARVVRQLSETTERGHRSARSADPPDHSAASCRIS